MNAPKRQLRIAIAMNGGVSLAVWMGGVAHELDVLRRASSNGPAPDDPCELKLFEAWRALAAELGVEVVVDTVAGTSAGGLNGTLLATAVARGVPLAGLKDVWLEAGSLRRDTLLQPSGSGAVPSLLNGTFFRDEVARVLTDNFGHGPDPRDVTLFVTATAVHTPDVTFVDGYGADMDVPDHRRLYRFRRRSEVQTYKPTQQGPHFDPGEPDDDFQETGEDSALTLAARASAGFPLAFQAIRETDTMRKLRRRPLPESAGLAWLIDGGVLDNAPFGPLLDEIRQRPVEGPWQRVLCYVVPSGARPQEGAAAAEAEPPWTSVLGGSFSLPREADLRGDIEELTALLRQSGDDGQLLLERILRIWPDEQSLDVDELWTGAQALLPLYREARAATGIWDVLAARAAEQTVGYLAPPAQLRGSEVLALDPEWVPAALDAPVDPWPWGLAAADRAVRFMLRSLRTLALAGRDVPEGAFSTVDTALREIEAVTEVFNGEIGGRLPQLGSDPVPSPAALGRIVGSINQLMTELYVPQALGDAVAAAALAYATVVGSSPDDVFRALRIVEVTAVTTAGWQPYGRAPSFEFARFGPDVPSPLFSDSSTDLKLYGTRIMHFGAFGEADWRQWDWTWGRLDAVTHLVRVLAAHNPDVDQTARIRELQQLVLECESSGEPDVPAMQERLTKVVELDDTKLRQALTATDDGRKSVATLAETALRLAWGTDDVPQFVRTVGRVVNVTLARTPAGSVAHTMLWRAAGFLPRRWLRRRLGDPYP